MSPLRLACRVHGCLLVLIGWALVLPVSNPLRAQSLEEVAAASLRNMVKVYGAGGLQRLEAYQSGILISERGEVLTALSYVLDTNSPLVVLADGRKFVGQLVAGDPQLGLALLKIDATDTPHFEWDQLPDVAELRPGTRVLALSNLFGVAQGQESVSVQRGVVAAITPRSMLEANASLPNLDLLVLDAVTSNPGAAGGAVVDLTGNLVGILAGDLRDDRQGIWLNVAIPLAAHRDAVVALREGRAARPLTPATSTPPVLAWNTELLGITLIPDVLPRTPAFVDTVWSNAPARAAGLRPDDLIVAINDQLVSSCRSCQTALAASPRDRPLAISVVRGDRLLNFRFESPAERAP